MAHLLMQHIPSNYEQPKHQTNMKHYVFLLRRTTNYKSELIF